MVSEEDLAEARREIDDLKADLEACSVRAHLVTEEMQHFVYAVSHDLRQPLRTISSFAQLLKRQYAADAETSELTSLIAEAAAEMNTLIEELLRYSRINTLPARIMVNLTSIVQWAWLNLQTQVRASGAEITYQDLPEVCVDESQFVQLFQQLFSNSLKFRSAEAPKIEVTAQEDAGTYTISVRDNGIGVDPNYCDGVFAPFKRLHGKELPGVGLGLAVCRKIMRAHGGEIWLESEPGHGSVFKLTLPV